MRGARNPAQLAHLNGIQLMKETDIVSEALCVQFASSGAMFKFISE
jgi:hypothetical protein